MRHSSMRFVLLGLWCFAVLFVFSGVALGGVTSECPDFLTPERQAEILQFQAGGHILAFSSDKVYMAGLGYALIEEFVGASQVMPVAGTSKDNGPLNGEQTSAKGAPKFQGVAYPELWQGVTLRYDRTSGGLSESVYVIKPGAHVETIRIRYNADFEIEEDGGLRFRHPSKKGYFTLSRPVAWQEIDGLKIPVAVSFKDHGDRTLGFTVDAWNPDYALVIDPVYQWHSFYGSGSEDDGYGIAVTTEGVYITGWSRSTWNGDGDTAPLHAYSGGDDIVVLKLNTSGAYQWHTFYGSPIGDVGYDISVTGDAVYVTGMSRSTWKGDGNTGPLHAYSGTYDILVLKLNTSGAYQWHTFYGSTTGKHYGYGISVTADGAYVTGSSSALWNGDGDTAPLHAHSGGDDIAVLKLNPSGVYQWHTFYGSGSTDNGRSIIVTADGAYVTGSSYSSWNGDGDTAPLHALSGNGDILVLKLNASGVYQWHTFYGSATGGDQGFGIAATTDGIYVTGNSLLNWNGDGDAAPLHAYSGGDDIVVLKLNTSGAYQWHTFYGSAVNDDQGYDIAVTGDAVYVTGGNMEPWIGPEDQAPMHAHSGSYDLLILKLDADGAYQWHTFYGSSGSSDSGYDLAATGDAVYVTGWATATWNGDGDAGPLHAHSGSDDIVVLKLFDGPTYAVTYDPNEATSGTAPEGQVKIHDVDLTLADNTGNLAKTGYTFAGWNTAADGTGTAYAEGGTYTANEAATLYAQWTANAYTVTFDANGGAAPDPASKQVTYDGVYGDLATTTRSGYTFDGWFTAGSGGTQVTSVSVVTTADDHTLYAQWTANVYTVTFDANGGAAPDPASKQVTYDGVYGDLATTTRSGYTFDGWFTAGSGGTQVTSVSVVTTADDHTLYAQWTANVYTVTFDANGGAAPDPASKQVTYDGVYGDLATTTRSGYIFDGWFTAVSGGTQVTSGTTVTMAADHTLYAQWTLIPTNPVILVTPASLDFGNISVGSMKDLFLTVKNTGDGILTGTATTAEPFIVFDGSYSIGQDQTKIVTVRFQPTTEGMYTGTVVFTGGGGATIPVNGNTLKPCAFPWLLLLLGD